MGLINYKDIDFNKSINKELTIFDFNGSEVAIVPYLSINDKYDLVMTTINKSYGDGIYNPLKIKMCFELGLVYKYSNIVFTQDELDDEVALYDVLCRSGLLELIKNHIDKEELEKVYTYLYETLSKIEENQSHFFSVINNLIQELPTISDKLKDLTQNLSGEKIQNFLSLLEANKNKQD